MREYQTNLDGMQVTNSLGGGGQPPFSQEMIAEFQFISNRFDATQGRSQGVQVNVVTKSGTNRLAGSFRANFRDDRFNAENPVLRPQGADLEPAVRRFGRRADHPGPAPLLRLLRVRARAAREHLEHAVSRASTSS